MSEFGLDASAQLAMILITFGSLSGSVKSSVFASLSGVSLRRFGTPSVT
jgi:hypothetical protein